MLAQALELNAAGSAGTKSGNEVAFLSMLNDLPEPLVNTKLHGIEVDFHWPGQRRIVEIDGQHHRRRATKIEDAHRDEHFTSEGWSVTRIEV